ncbi:alpha/beta hydrolase [Inquilinus sp. CAU 1745]|uniref:alpha/beta fold hydrolase n=1 Tax=Inquilinus sp. CAU 1745 TaxID=3140369 RepID=UPI00325B1D35
MIETYTVEGGGGVPLSVMAAGPRDGPAILFIHGFSQSCLCWMRQFEGALAERYRLVAFDLRGHGVSGRPERTASYTAGRLWAEDVAAVIAGSGIDRPALVGWSYAGFVIGDYLRRFGQEGIAGINLVAATTLIGTDEVPALLGQGLLANSPTMCRDELAANIAATRRFVRACSARPLPPDWHETMLAFNMTVPPFVRRALFSRAEDFDDVLSSIRLPVLLTHGTADDIVLPAMTDRIARAMPAARLSLYDGIGHMPFVEDQPRFNRELAAFVDAT